MARIIVVGAGVVGLTCAVRLLESGHQVGVVARDLPLETTSSVAAAFWMPFLAEPYQRVAAWSKRSYDVFAELSSDTETGVVMREGTKYMKTWHVPSWAGALPTFERVDDVPKPYGAAMNFTSPIAEMPIYLRWLGKRVEALGGTITRMALSGLPDHAEVVVNATGLGARLMAGDTAVAPVRGQVVVVEQFGLERWSEDEDGPTYVFPRSKDVVVGGTTEAGEWNRTPDPATARLILERASVLVPGLAKAKVIQHKVGLRPARPAVRLERVDNVIHCYGHGGAGVTLSWGCADEVVELVATA